jgi:hypothetical protein
MLPVTRVTPAGTAQRAAAPPKPPPLVETRAPQRTVSDSTGVRHQFEPSAEIVVPTRAVARRLDTMPALDAQRTARSTSDEPLEAMPARRPGLDLHAGLFAERVAPPATTAVAPTTVTRSVAATAATADLPTRRPGLDLHAALSATHVVRSEERRAHALAPAEARPAADHAPTANLATASAPAQVPEPAAAPPPVVALPSPPGPPLPAVQRVVTAFPSQDDDAEGGLLSAPDDQLEELAGRLYDHIRSRFRAELLIDRERAGLLADRY